MEKLILTVFMVAIGAFNVLAQSDKVDWVPELTEVLEPVPEVIEPVLHSRPPSDAVILFDGTDFSEWTSGPEFFMSMSTIPEYLPQLEKEGEPAQWEITDDYMTVVPGTGNIMTKQKFGDIQLHIEWRTPEAIDGDGQGRGNSGVFLQGLYEVQVLDSYNNSTYPNGQAASVYKQEIPMVNASLPPGEWQSYDIIFEAPVFKKDGSVAKPAFVTVIQNGIVVQNHTEIKGPTVFIGLPHYEPHSDKLPIILQDHSDLVSFRNIWVREL